MWRKEYVPVSSYYDIYILYTFKYIVFPNTIVSEFSPRYSPTIVNLPFGDGFSTHEKKEILVVYGIGFTIIYHHVYPIVIPFESSNGSSPISPIDGKILLNSMMIPILEKNIKDLAANSLKFVKNSCWTPIEYPINIPSLSHFSHYFPIIIPLKSPTVWHPSLSWPFWLAWESLPNKVAALPAMQSTIPSTFRT